MVKYIVVYGYDNTKSFSSKSDLLNFLKSEFDKFKNKMNVRNYFLSNNNMIELQFNRLYTYWIGISKCDNQFELTKWLYYDIGKYLGCFSEII